MVKGSFRRLDEARLVSPKLMAKIGFFVTLFVAPRLEYRGCAAASGLLISEKDKRFSVERKRRRSR